MKKKVKREFEMHLRAGPLTETHPCEENPNRDIRYAISKPVGIYLNDELPKISYWIMTFVHYNSSTHIKNMGDEDIYVTTYYYELYDMEKN